MFSEACQPSTLMEDWFESLSDSIHERAICQHITGSSSVVSRKRGNSPLKDKSWALKLPLNAPLNDKSWGQHC